MQNRFLHYSSFIKIFFLVVSLLLSEISHSQDSINTLYHNFSYTNDSINFSLIDKYVQNKDVILLGEIVHGEKDVTILKTKIVKYLIEKHNFNVLAFESSFYDFAPSKTPLKYEKSIFPVWTETKAFQPMLRYLDNHKSIIVSGFDNQISFNGFQNLISLLKSHTTSLSKSDELFLLNTIEYATSNYDTPDNFNFFRFKSLIEKLKQKTNDLYLSQIYDNILSDISNKQKHGQLKKSEWKAKYSNIRDEQMAENLLFLYTFYNKPKIICWGANTHFGNKFSDLNNDELQGYNSMGSFIKKALGDKLLTIGFSAKRGTYLNSYLEEENVPSVEKNAVEDIKFENHIESKIFESINFDKVTSFSNLIEFTPLKGTFNKVFDLVIILDSISHINYSTFSKEQEVNLLKEEKFFFITDVKTNDSLPFCNISYLNHNIGTTSDYGGRFSIPQFADTIVISSIGYKTKKIAYLDLKTVTNLETDIYTVDEVMVKEKRNNVISIMEAVIDSLNYRLNTSGYQYVAKINQVSIANQDTFVNTSALKDVYVKYNPTEKKDNQIQESYNKTLFYYLRNNNWAIYNPLIRSNILMSDINLFNKRRLNGYRFKINSEESTSTIYVINFSTDKSKRSYTGDYWNKYFYGKIFIDKVNYAIKKLDYTTIRDTAKFNSLVLNRKYKYRRYIRSGLSTSLHFYASKQYYYLKKAKRIMFSEYQSLISKEFISESIYHDMELESDIIENALPLKKIKDNINEK